MSSMRSGLAAAAGCLLLMLFWVVFEGRGMSAPGEATISRAAPIHSAVEVFEPIEQHVHGPSIVELPNGDLLACWFEGSGERWADDVRIRGSRLVRGAVEWSRPFTMADTSGFPDINPVLFIDGKERLWLLWYTVLANLWETSLPKYRISSNYMMADGPPEWDWQEVLHAKPGDSTERGIQPGDSFVEAVRRKAGEYTEYLERIGFFVEGSPEDRGSRTWWDQRVERMVDRAAGRDLLSTGHFYHEDGTHSVQEMGFPLMRRIGWQSYNKPLILQEGRMVVPFYSDGFSFSLMALTDDWGEGWTFSEPLPGAGNIQAGLAERSDGTLVAYMRNNGPLPKRLHMAESLDRGETWSTVRYADLPNPGSGADVLTLNNGHWLIVYNDTESGRHSLAAAISTDEGRTWRWKRRLELDVRPEGAVRSHYPAVIQGADGLIHLVYSFHYEENGLRRRTVKYVRFDEAWVHQGEPGFAERGDVFLPTEGRSPLSSHAASLLELPNGEILYVFNGEHVEGPTVETRWGRRPASRVFLSRWKPGSRSWSPLQVLARDDPVEIHNPVLWHDGKDSLFLFYTTMEGQRHEESTLDLLTSNDGGRTWSPPRSIRSEWGWMFGTSPVRMSNGEILMPVYRERSPGGVGFLISDDDFAGWEVHPADPDGWPVPGIMAAVVELRPGELLAFLRSSGRILRTRSFDYGRTWTPTEPTELPNPWSRLALIRLRSGNLLMAHNPTPTSPRTPLRLSLSSDGGETWPFWVEVETDLEGRYDYPYLIQTSDGRIHLGYSHDNKSNVRHVVFDEDFVRSGVSLTSDPSPVRAVFKDGEFRIVPR